MSFIYNEDEQRLRLERVALLVGLGLLLIFSYFSYVDPMLQPWYADLKGRAELAQAEQNRQISIIEAQAKLESAQHIADAEITRAKGIAEANKIIANSLTKEYLQYRFIEGLNDGNTEVIYVPTEANLPILEARDK